VLQLTVNLPPSINAQYATVDGRRILSESARRWKKEVGKQLELLEDRGVLSEALKEAFQQCYLSVFLEFFFTTPHRRDLDGGLKITLDALCTGLGLNDNRVVDIHLVKRIDPLNPRLEIGLEGVSEWQFDTEYEVYLPEKDS
jgi:crossover junction endodeoxyribonuclease RusA